MTRAPWTEQWQPFTSDVRKQFWGGLTPHTRQLLAFTRSTGESQAAREGLLHDLYRRGREGRQLQLIVTDGCAGLATSLQTIYPRVAHQRCWVHKLRNLLSTARRRDHAAMKADAQAIYRAASQGAGLRPSVARGVPATRDAAAPESSRVARVLPVSTGSLAEAADH